jgi:ribonuclease Z
MPESSWRGLGERFTTRKVPSPAVEVVTLGTGSPLPDPNRAGPATLVRGREWNLLFDCGRGVLMRLAAVGVLPGALDRVLLTHRHSDHITDLNDVITMRWAMAPTPAPLALSGPPGTAELIDRTMAMLAEDIAYRMAHHADLTAPPECTVDEVLDGVVIGEPDVRVVAAPTDHWPVSPTVGYRVEAEGRAVVIGGDTVPCEGLDRLCAGADLYVQTVVLPDLVRAIPAPRLQDILDYHSSCEDAGRTAARGGVQKLVLTHPVPPPAPGSETDWVAAAAAHFDGEITLASDLSTFTF